MISDGYENSPAGRVHEVMYQITNMGIDTPVYHINPTASAEAGGVRSLSDLVRTVSIGRPADLPTAMLGSLINTAVIKALEQLLPPVLEDIA